MESRLIPTNDFVLLEEAKAEPYQQWKGYSKIVVPDIYQYGPEDRHIIGQVIAKGEDCIKTTIPVGAIAITGKWSGARFPRDGKSYVLVKEGDILAVIE